RLLGSPSKSTAMQAHCAGVYCGASVQLTRRLQLEFFNLKTKQKVEIPDNQLKKRRSVRTTSGGKRQERYAVIAVVHEGGKPLQSEERRVGKECRSRGAR